MKNRCRIRSDKNIVSDLTVELLGPDDEYVDISPCVTGASVTLNVGELGRTHLDLRTTDVEVEVVGFDDETLAAFAHVLADNGWTVEAPA